MYQSKNTWSTSGITVAGSQHENQKESIKYKVKFSLVHEFFFAKKTDVKKDSYIYLQIQQISQILT